MQLLCCLGYSAEKPFLFSCLETMMNHVRLFIAKKGIKNTGFPSRPMPPLALLVHGGTYILVAAMLTRSFEQKK